MRFLPGLSLASLLAGIIAGIGFASWSGQTTVIIAIAVVLASLILFPLLKKEGVRGRSDLALYPLIALAGVGLGLLRFQETGPGEHSIALLAGGDDVVKAIVVRHEFTDNSQKLTLGDLTVRDEWFDDHLLATVPRYPELPVGARISLRCAFEAPEPFDGFAYDKYLATKDIYALCRTFDEPFLIDPYAVSNVSVQLARLHDRIVVGIERIFGEPQATLLAGLLIGDNTFSQEWKDRFIATGTSHIVAASGTNIAIVASVVMAIALQLGLRRQRAYSLVLQGIFAFVIIAGAEAAVTRAGIMAALVLTARHLGRKTSPRNILLATAAAMLLMNPLLMRYDVGFQLSIVSTIGLMWLSKPFGERLAWIPETLGLREALATTLAATVATLPIVILNFGRVALVGPIANLLVLPFVPYAMGFGAAATAIGALSQSLGAFVALPAWTCLTAMLEVIRSLSNIPPWFGLIPLVIVAIALLFPLHEVEGVRGRRAAYVIFAIVTLVLLARQLWLRDGLAPQGTTVWVFDIGQGDAIFVDGPERDVLIDGGPDFKVLEKLSAVLPWWDRSVDVVVNTHPHADHLVGLVPVIARYHVDEVLDADQGYTTPEFDEYLQVAGEHRRVIAKGEVIDLGGGATLTALAPPTSYDGAKLDDPNDGSIIFLLNDHGQTMLLTGDAGVEQEARIVSDLGHLDVLKVGHHGSDTSTSPALLEATEPQTAIISVGEGNDYGHPSAFVVSRLLEAGVEVFRTDQDGDVRVRFVNDEVKTKNFLDIF